jgi:thymidylate synthase
MIEGDTIQNVHKTLVKYILDNGVMHDNERGGKWLECLDVVTRLTNPLNLDRSESYKRLLPHAIFNGLQSHIYDNDDYPFKPTLVAEYITEFMNPMNNGFTYTYGNRLRSHFAVDQIEEIVKRLNKNSNTNRAVAITYDPFIDTQCDEIPCFMMLDCKIRDNKLYTTGIWRSHDGFLGYYSNLFAVQYMVQSIMRNYNKDKSYNELIDFGSITTLSASIHIYENDIPEARKYIKNEVKI